MGLFVSGASALPADFGYSLNLKSLGMGAGQGESELG